MIKKRLFLVCALMLLSACGFFKKDKPPPLPEPTCVALKFEASGNINPNHEGRASPLFLRIYQLKSYSAFEDADFFSLYEDDEQVLGKALVNKEEILLRPNAKRTVFYEEVSDDVRTIGIFGLFRDEQAQWRAAAGIHPNKTNVVNIYISGIKVNIR